MLRIILLILFTANPAWAFSVMPISHHDVVAPPVAGVVSFGSVNGNHVEAATSLLITAPTGIEAGNYLMASIISDINQAVTFPTGWTQITEVTSSTSRLACAYKIAVSADVTAANYTFTVPASTEITGSILRLTKTSGSWNVQDSQTLVQSAGNVVVPTVTADQNGSLLAVFFGNDDNFPITTSPVNSGMTEAYSYMAADPNSKAWYQHVNAGAQSGHAINIDGGDYSVISLIIEAQ